MHTCDYCSVDTNDRENLTAVVLKDGSGDGFYDSDIPGLPNADVLVCSDCLDKHGDAFVVVEGAGALEEYIEGMRATYKTLLEHSEFSTAKPASHRRKLRQLEASIAGLLEHVRSDGDAG